jgi:hypothetical protein
MDIGICVKVQHQAYHSGRTALVAKHKHDRDTTWKVVKKDSVDSAIDHMELVQLWMDKFTGSVSAGYRASYKVIARGSDYEGFYFILVPTAYH